MNMTRTLKLGSMLYGVGPRPNDWRHPEATPDAATRLEYFKEQARICEDGKFDFVLVADSLALSDKPGPLYLTRLEPLTLLSALAEATSRIGLIGTVSTTYSEPFNVARQFASLDHISGGRAGWNVVTTAQPAAAANFSETAHPDPSARYRVADEYLQVVRGLWGSWEDGAFIRDKQTGVFFTPGTLHPLNHDGEFFSVKGPLNIARSRQGHPVIFQAGSSEDEMNFAARHADAVIVDHQYLGADDDEILEGARRHYRLLKEKAAGFGRNPDDILVFVVFFPVVGRTEADAQAKFDRMQALVSIDEALAILGGAFGRYDFSKHALDEPFPDLGAQGENSYAGHVANITRIAKVQGLTLREVALWFAAAKGTSLGTGEQVPDARHRWFEAGAADGFFSGEYLNSEIAAFVDLVVPVLQERGLFRTEYERDTLRGHFGLRAPPN